MTIMPANVVTLMAKFPIKGEVKTRLAAQVGQDRALEIYKALLENTIEKCRPGKKEDYCFGLAITPVNLLERFTVEYPGLDFYFPQNGDDLGSRMNHALNQILSDKDNQKAILIGADIPDLRDEIIEDALSGLNENDLVFGPTVDGGYYLIGLKSPAPWLFEGISWGGTDVLETSLRYADQQGLSYHLLKQLSDLDRWEDLKLFPFLNDSNFDQ